MNDDIEILHYSDMKYEKLTSEVRYRNVPIMQVNQEAGKDAMEIEVFTDFCKEKFVVKLPLEDLINALKLAKEVLL